MGQDSKVVKELAVRLVKARIVYQIWRQNVLKTRYLSKDAKVNVFSEL